MFGLNQGIGFILEFVSAFVGTTELYSPDLLLSLKMLRIIQLKLVIWILPNSIWNLEFCTQIIDIFGLWEYLLNLCGLLILCDLQGLAKLLPHICDSPLELSNLPILLLSQELEVVPFSLQLPVVHPHILRRALQLLFQPDDFQVQLTVLGHDSLVFPH